MRVLVSFKLTYLCYFISHANSLPSSHCLHHPDILVELQAYGTKANGELRWEFIFSCWWLVRSLFVWALCNWNLSYTIHTHTHAGIQTDDLIFFCVYWCVSAQTVTTCVCIRSEDTHMSKRNNASLPRTHTMSSVEPMTHICSKQLVTLSPKVFFSRISTYVTRLRFRYVTPWILARFSREK